jgi:hypothetical protein
MHGPAEVLESAAAGDAIPLFQWFNPMANAAIIQRATRYRARNGTQPLFPTPHEADEYDAGWDAWPQPLALGDNNARWLGWFDHQEAK